MKKPVAFLLILFHFLIFIYSCEKENSGDIVNPARNQPPVASAGTDQTTRLPNNIVILDGSNSTDPNNNIADYTWTKISGPSFFSINNKNAVSPQVSGLEMGIYQFELKVTDAGGLFSTDTVLVTVVIPQQNSGNVLFFFRDYTGGLDAEQIGVIESFSPRIILVKVKIANYPDAEIEGVWSINYSPWCPISSIYVDQTAFGLFTLPPGTYNWSAESVTMNLTTYPVPTSFKNYWEAGPHTAKGTITVPLGSTCILKEIIF
jgi:hypothetical protein